MKIRFVFLLLCTVVPSAVNGQNDSTGTLLFQPKDYVKKPTVISVDGKSVTVNTDLTFNRPFNEYEDPIEREIKVLESRESDALQRRDTAELRKLWARDFTADIPANKIMNDKLGLPYYESYSRIVEHLEIKDGQAFSNGTEFVRLMDEKTKTITTVIKKYMHIWKMGSGGWRLISKFGYEVKQ